VIIGGSIVVRGGAVENVNEREVVAEAQAAAARLTAGHLGLESSRREEES